MCAEAQLIALKEAGITAVKYCYEETTDPETLLNLVEKSDQVVRIYPRSSL
jgi:hypothetical protein